MRRQTAKRVSSMSSTATLRFRDRFKDLIGDGTKRSTIRLNLSDDIGLGSQISAIDESGEAFGWFEVSAYQFTTVEDAVCIDIPGHRGYRNGSHLIRELQEYYPHSEIERTTQVDILTWENFHDFVDPEDATRIQKLEPGQSSLEELHCVQLNHSAFRVVHEPTGQFVEYNIPPYARDMRITDQYALAKEYIVENGFEFDPTADPKSQTQTEGTD